MVNRSITDNREMTFSNGCCKIFNEFQSNEICYAVRFIAALFCEAQTQTRDPLPPASTLLTISKSMFWLYQFVKLADLAGRDITDEEFVLETRPGMNIIGEIRVSFSFILF